MRGAALVATCILLLPPGCGRSRLGGRDGGNPDARPASAADAPDGASDPPSESPSPALADGAVESSLDLPPRDAWPADVAGADVEPDAAALPDVSLRDSRLADVAGDAVALDTAATVDLPPPGCAPLLNDGVLNLGHIKQALFAPDGRSLLVRIGAADTDATDDARLISLPDGASRVLGRGVRNVEWLGPSAALLTIADQLLAVSLDGKVLLSLPTPTCSHAATPDGSRIYYNSECDRVSGALSVADLASGTSKELAANVSPSSLVVSPDGRWAAYLVYEGDSSSRTGVVHVADATGATYAVTGPASATQPVFVSGEILLLQESGSGSVESSLWRHDLGTGNSRSLSKGDVGIAGYEIAADGSALLMARFSGVGMAGELYHVPLDGSGPVRLAIDVMDYRMYSMAIRVFAFARPSQRVLYIADVSSDAGRTYGVASVSPDGSQRFQLSAGSSDAVVSSFADRVAVVAVDHTLGGGSITVVSASGARQFAIDVTGDISFAGFVPRDRGLLFVQMSVDKTLGPTSVLRHLSFTTGKVTTLAWWNMSTLALYRYPLGISSSEYPSDPNGCYIVVDSDYEQTASRLVALPD